MKVGDFLQTIYKECTAIGIITSLQDYIHVSGCTKFKDKVNFEHVNVSAEGAFISREVLNISLVEFVELLKDMRCSSSHIIKLIKIYNKLHSE